MDRINKMTTEESIRKFSLKAKVALIVGEIANFTRNGGLKNELAFSLLKLIMLCGAFILIRDSRAVQDQVKASLAEIYLELQALRRKFEENF